MGKLVDRTGQRFGNLVVLHQAGKDNQGRKNWLCLCDCGTEKVIASRHLGSGATASCGCLVKITSAENGRRTTGISRVYYKEVVSYYAAHQRIYARKGFASAHKCIDCGKQAEHWSYDLSDPLEVTQGKLIYSLDPDYYKPRCIKCHSNHDWKNK